MSLFSSRAGWLFGAMAVACVPGVCVAESRENTNHLAAESSPYLRQHVSNPVAWYPWGAEALERAKREDKLIFLSIGYSTCHWCHVMERECFEKQDVADALNPNFICIKVDREERPDLDRVYQLFLQASNGEGGWPATLWLTPDLKPVFGTTYIPRQDEEGRPGLLTLSKKLATLWSSQRDEVVKGSDTMLAALQAADPTDTQGFDITARLQKALAQAASQFDARSAGFDTGAKFPPHSILQLLLSQDGKLAANQERAMLEATLQKMAEGGLRDHVGGGFHRYTVDPEWHTPHFEKMLSDQAQLAALYLEAGERFQRPDWIAVGRETLRYLTDDLRSPEGGFWTAEDAESGPASEEGGFYLWTAAQLQEALGTSTEEFAKRYVLPAENERFSLRLRDGVPLVSTDVVGALEKLRAVRAGRQRPFRDEKILTAENGLALSAFCRAASLPDDKKAFDVAARLASYLRDRHYDARTGLLTRSLLQGNPSGQAFAEDYAYVIRGALDFYAITLDASWLAWAEALQEKQNDLFGLPDGTYSTTVKEAPGVVLRLVEDSDGAEPAATSVSLGNLARLGNLLHREDWSLRARNLLGHFSTQLDRSPLAMPWLLAEASVLQHTPRQILVVGEPDASDTQRLLAAARRHASPSTALILVDRVNRPVLTRLSALPPDFPAEESGAAKGFLCEGRTCRLPTSDPVAFEASLSALKP